MTSDRDRALASGIIANKRAEAAFTRLAKKLARITHQLEEMGENDMGLLMTAQARKFHKGTQELIELNGWIQRQLALAFSKQEPTT